MNTLEPGSTQIQALKEIELWLRSHHEDRENVNRIIFGVSNKMRVHPHDLAIYILIRTASI